MTQLNEYQATVVRRAWFRNKLETRLVLAPNKIEALRETGRHYPKRVTITVKFVRSLPRG